jgi:RNA polymerase sigma-70 factor (ECF subfamily)
VADTPISLLERLQLRPDSVSWERLVSLYTPLISGWLARYRRWLRTIAVNRLRTLWRTRASADDVLLTQLEDPASDPNRRWDEEHDRFVARRLLELLEPEFEPPTWAAFRLLVLEGVETREVAVRLNTTPNAVRIAKSRVLSRFRREIEGLID